MRAAATTTSTKARQRVVTVRAPSPIGSPKTTMPAGIADALLAIDVTAMTATASPTCSDRADAKNAATAAASASGR